MSAVRCVAFSPGGAMIATGDQDGIVQMWDNRTGQCRLEFPGHSGQIWSLAFSPDGKALVTAGQDGAVRVWDGRTGLLLASLPEHEAGARSVAFRPDGTLLAVGYEDRLIELWDGNSFDHPHLLGSMPAEAAVASLAFSVDGAILAGASDGSIRLWNVAVPASARLLSDPFGQEKAAAVTFCLGPKILAIGGEDGVVRLWDVADPTCPSLLHRGLRHCADGAVWSVAFAPDGVTLASGGEDGTVSIWDVGTGHRAEMPTVNVGAVWSVAFSPAGATVAAGGRGGAVALPRGRPGTLWQRKCWRDAFKPVPNLFDWYKGNVAAGTLFLALFLVLKGFVLAKGDTTTALGILQYAGLSSVVIAGLLSSLPLLASAMLALGIFRVVGGQQLTFPLGLVTAGWAVLCAVFAPWPVMTISAGLGLVFGLGRRFVERWMARSLIRTSLRLLAGGILFVWAVYALIAVLYSVWLPHESVKFTPGPRGYPPAQQTGYVLTEDNGWITILTSGSHEIVRYPDSAVKSFMLCQRVPLNDLSYVTEARTLWQEFTLLRPLKIVRATANTPCPPAGP
ncbi:MAG: WD40 repeat domain-containing protein [Streptosporangiaceae bacterium]